MKTVLQIVPCKGWGGGERYVYDLTQQLQYRGDNVVVVGRKSKVVADKFATLGSYTVLPLLFLFDFYSAFKLGRIVSKNGVDVIHVHIFKDAFMAVFARFFTRRKFRVVMTRHQVKRAKIGFLYRWLYRSLDVLIFVSNCAKDEFMSTSPVVDCSKLVVIHNSIDCSRLGLIPSVAPLSGTAVIGYAGRISSEKGIDKLFGALSILKSRGLDFRCEVVGTGLSSYVSYIEQLLIDEGLSDCVVMRGFSDDMGRFISSIDIAVLPSIWVEPCSLMAIEYMSAGRPLVASNRGGHSELIEHGVDGWLVEARDSVALADALQYMLDNEDKRIAIGNAAAVKYVERLSFREFIDKILEQYEKGRDSK